MGLRCMTNTINKTRRRTHSRGFNYVIEAIEVHNMSKNKERLITLSGKMFFFSSSGFDQNAKGAVDSNLKTNKKESACLSIDCYQR